MQNSDAGRTEKKIAAIILAAGASTRLGEPKQLIEIGGLPLVRRAAMAAIEAGASPIVVVLGADNHQILPALEGLPDVRIALNSRWETGLASSLAAGLSALADHPEIDGALIVLADQPFVDAHALKTLADAFGTDRIVASSYSNIVGVPAVIGREFFGELSQLTGDKGAGPWLRTRTEGVMSIPLLASPLDIDTPQDVAVMRQLD
jgi:CTP:molybdopterin cytidylyltransferase MocA